MNNNNLPSITVDTFTKIVEMQFNERNFRPIFGLGKGGIGKTESIMDLALNKLHIGYVDVRLLLYSETDLKGIPYPSADHTRTVWLQNDILPTETRDGKSGILVFDEITSCARSVRTAAYQLLNERRLGEYVLPEGWMIVCLGNGEDDGGDYQGMEGNFANRCSVFNVVPDLDSWKLWARSHNVNPLVLGYVTWKPQDLHTYNPDSETQTLFASPRSWTAVSNILNLHEYSVDDVVLNNRIMANIGTDIGMQFIAFCKFRSATVDPMRILIYGEKPQITQQEIIYITISSLTKIVGDAFAKDIANTGKCSLDTIKMLANAIKWVITLRKEVAVMGFKEIINCYGDDRKDKDIVKETILLPDFGNLCPELGEFSRNNKEIFK
jgi:hypothetical protein